MRRAKANDTVQLDEGQGSGAEQRGALSYEEAARYLDVSRSWLEHSNVPRVKLGRRVVFRVVDLDAYLEQRVA